MMTATPPTSSPRAVAGWEPVPDPVARDDPFPWWLSLVLGITSILFGLAVLAWPEETLRVAAFLIGVWLLLAGIARIVGAFRPGRGVGAQVLSGIVGVLLVVVAVACLRNLVTSVAMLATVIALTWLISGISELAIAFTLRGAARLGLILLGTVSVLVGVAFVVWPELSLASLVLMTGVGALVIGASQIAFAFQLRKLTASL